MDVAVVTATHRAGSAGESADAVKRAQAGEAAAFEDLYREHHGRVYALSLRMLRDEEQAEEMTQEIFVQVYEKLGSFRGDSRFSTWLHRLATNAILNRLRKRKRRARHHDRLQDEKRYGQAIRRAFPETRMALEVAIAQLPPGAREVLLLHDVEGFRYREIAERMGTALGTVKSQLHRARALLREALSA